MQPNQPNPPNPWQQPVNPGYQQQPAQQPQQQLQPAPQYQQASIDYRPASPAIGSDSSKKKLAIIGVIVSIWLLIILIIASFISYKVIVWDAERRLKNTLEKALPDDE